MTPSGSASVSRRSSCSPAQPFGRVHAFGHIDHLAANEPLRRIVEQIAVGDLEPDILAVAMAIAHDRPLAETRPAEHLHPIRNGGRAVVGMDEVEGFFAHQFPIAPAQDLGDGRAERQDDRHLVAIDRANAGPEQRGLLERAAEPDARADQHDEVDAEAVPGIHEVHRYLVAGIVAQMNHHLRGAPQADPFPSLDDGRKVARKAQFQRRPDPADGLSRDERHGGGPGDAQARFLRGQNVRRRIRAEQGIDHRIDGLGFKRLRLGRAAGNVEAFPRLHCVNYRRDWWPSWSTLCKILVRESIAT
jgi:hypothetical protein